MHIVMECMHGSNTQPMKNNLPVPKGECFTQEAPIMMPKSADSKKKRRVQRRAHCVASFCKLMAHLLAWLTAHATAGVTASLITQSMAHQAFVVFNEHVAHMLFA